MGYQNPGNPDTFTLIPPPPIYGNGPPQNYQYNQLGGQHPNIPVPVYNTNYPTEDRNSLNRENATTHFGQPLPLNRNSGTLGTT